MPRVAKRSKKEAEARSPSPPPLGRMTRSRTRAQPSPPPPVVVKKDKKVTEAKKRKQPERKARAPRTASASTGTRNRTSRRSKLNAAGQAVVVASKPLPSSSRTTVGSTPNLAESHDIDIMVDPQLQGSADSDTENHVVVQYKVKDEVPSTSSEAMRRNANTGSRAFFHEMVENWRYQGIKPALNFNTAEVQRKLMHLLWHEVKVLSGSLIRVFVGCRNGDEDEDWSTTLEFKVCNYALKRGKPTNEPLAVVTATSLDNKIGFMFKILDYDLAKKSRISLECLKGACERVFGTNILRCTGVSGDLGIKVIEEIDL